MIKTINLDLVMTGAEWKAEEEWLSHYFFGIRDDRIFTNRKVATGLSDDLFKY